MFIVSPFKFDTTGVDLETIADNYVSGSNFALE